METASIMLQRICNISPLVLSVCGLALLSRHPMTETKPRNDASSKPQDFTPESDIEISSPLSASELTSTYAGIGKLGEKSKGSDGFNLSDQSTWGDIYGRAGELAKAWRGAAFASTDEQFGRTVDGGIETQEGQVGQSRAAGDRTSL